MAYVSTVPAAIAAAATQLEGIGNSFSAESAAAAAPTTAIAPAASDEVSALQAGMFSTYGQLYQTVSAEAQAIHQQFVNLLQSSSNSYQETESANQAGAAASSLSERDRRAASSAAIRPSPASSPALPPSLPTDLVFCPAARTATSSRCRWMRWVTSPPPNRTSSVWAVAV